MGELEWVKSEGKSQSVFPKMNSSRKAHLIMAACQLEMIHDYIHSFRFAQAQNVMKMFSLSLFFFIILLVGNSVYYKSRGGEWAVRHAG